MNIISFYDINAVCIMWSRLWPDCHGALSSIVARVLSMQVVQTGALSTAFVRLGWLVSRP